jgi:hypothetical protein
MFSLADLTVDPDLSECLTIIRSSGKFKAGVWQNQQQEINASGTVVIASDEALAQVPEGDRVQGSIHLVCAQPIYETLVQRGPETNQIGAGLSDVVKWNGILYRVQSVQPWKKYCIWSAILVRMPEE